MIRIDVNNGIGGDSQRHRSIALLSIALLSIALLSIALLSIAPLSLPS